MIWIEVEMGEFGDIIEKIDELPYDSQRMLVDIIQKRLAEVERNLFIEDVLESKKEFEDGKYTEGNSEDLFKALNI